MFASLRLAHRVSARGSLSLPLVSKPSVSAIRGAGFGRSFHSSSFARNDTMTVNVNGTDVQVPKGVTVMQACFEGGVDIPRFCYHDRLSIAGNCRMCLVEVEKSPKPVASCAMPAMPGMKIKTDTPMVYKAREGVMELLLINHPLDCPICDQGGECDLQDQSLIFGSDRSRFREYKRVVEDKNLGPFVKTVMTRCIHCTRCVRFAAEIAGVPVLGATGRGGSMEIGTYVDKFFDSEMSGNVIDLCPVGALTSKPFAFTARPWELTHTESVDVLDALGCNIRIDTRGTDVMRILPRLHEEVNEEWISDKTRFAYDGLKRQRLDIPLVKQGGELAPVSWSEAFAAIHNQLKGLNGNQIKGIVGDLVDAEAITVFKDLLNRLGSENIDCRQDGANLNADIRSSYTFNSTLAGIEESDCVLLVGTNTRMEAPLLNHRLRKATVQQSSQVAYIGPAVDFNFSATHLGNDAATLASLADGSHPFSATLKAAKKPAVIIGMSALRRADSGALTALLQQMTQTFPNLRSATWNGINTLQLAAARSAALDLGCVPGVDADDTKVKFVYLLGADEWAPKAIPKDAFVVYQGHHGDAGASRADIVLPGCAYTEKEGTYVNTEGRVQRTRPALGPIGDARDDWSILRALSEVLGVALPYNTTRQVRARMADIAPHLDRIDVIEPAQFTAPVDAKAAGKLSKTPFEPAFSNFFMTDPISRSSRNMAKATTVLKKSSSSFV